MRQKVLEDYGQEFYKINEGAQKLSNWINKTQIILHCIQAGREGHSSQLSLIPCLRSTMEELSPGITDITTLWI